MARAKFTWDSKLGRYRDASGRIISRNVIAAEREKLREKVKSELRALDSRLQTGAINLPQWELDFRSIIKAAHLAMSALAQGGWAQMSPSLLGRIGQLTRMQYEKLAGFARDLESGRLSVKAKRFGWRSDLYAQAIDATFSEVERQMMIAAGYQWERLVRSKKESCEDCKGDSNLGWVAIGTLSPIGKDRACMVKCGCHFEYK